MTDAQASSSTSTLVRAIHQQYTTSQATPLSNQTRCEAARSFPRLGAGSGRYFTLWPGPLYRRLSDSVRLIAVLRGAHRPELAAWLWHQVSPKPSPTPSPSRWSAADRLYLFSERGKSATNPHGGLFRVGHSRSANSERLQPQARNDVEIVRPKTPVSCPPETPSCASRAVSTGMRTVVPSRPDRSTPG